jgi:hypothetical protein
MATFIKATLNYTPPTNKQMTVYLRFEDKGLKPPVEKPDELFNPFLRKNKDPRVVRIRDVRPEIHKWTNMDALDNRGFMYVKNKSPLSKADYYDNSIVMNRYYPACADLVKGQTGAAKVIVFDHVLRNKNAAGKLLQGGAPIQSPVGLCHNDYTPASARNRVLQLAAPIDVERTANTVKEQLLDKEEAEYLLATHRFAFINVWRSIGSYPVKDNSLAICDKKSFATGDFSNLKFVYPDRTGEISVAKYNPTHKWHYISDLVNDECILLKCYDSAFGGVPSAHAGFDLPNAPINYPSRESVEIRTIAFWPNNINSNKKMSKL